MNESTSLIVVLICYYVPARVIFDYVYNSSPVVIDEVFHLPIGIKYCQQNFTEWDNKITTLPGLYLFSTILAGPFQCCTVYSLRYTIFISSVINTGLIFFLRKHWLSGESKINRILNTFNIATMPPVLYFSMVYYTDILSMTLVNAMLLLGLKGKPFWASLLGFLAMITRQNNVVYVLFIVGFRFLGHAYNIITKTNIPDRYMKKWDYRYLRIKLRSFLREDLRTHNYTDLFIELLSYGVSILAMLLFVFLNGGIVVGDKTAHATAIHIPQLFYFSIFTMFFCFPHACAYLLPFFRYLCKQPFLNVLFFVIILLIIVFNTHVHPYLLADNRHYLFYIWRHFLAKSLQRQCAAPFYLCALYCLYRLCYRPTEPRFLLGYPIMLVLILCTQSLIDVRYYLTPYVILRTFVAPTTRIDLIIELLIQIAVSAFTLYTFGHKEIYWKDFGEVQRIIW